MLDSDQIVMIAVDMVNGNPPRVEGKEADDFRRELEEDMRVAEGNNWTIEVPTEWEVPG